METMPGSIRLLLALLGLACVTAGLLVAPFAQVAGAVLLVVAVALLVAAANGVEVAGAWPGRAGSSFRRAVVREVRAIGSGSPGSAAADRAASRDTAVPDSPGSGPAHEELAAGTSRPHEFARLVIAAYESEAARRREQEAADEEERRDRSATRRLIREGLARAQDPHRPPIVGDGRDVAGKRPSGA
ncbi:MAG TPA: hypothetical protein VHK06_04860 [Candidatus Limnocylindria bacterium]|nr:hypothetical protein [Candidatus Limnocylindria bacterium]